METRNDEQGTISRPSLSMRYLGTDGHERRGLVTMHMSGVITVRATDERGRGSDGRTVAYVDIIDRVEGEARWDDTNQFRMTLRGPALKLDRLNRQFTAIAAMPQAERGNLRANGRIRLTDPTTLVRVGGREGAGSIINVSRSGALVATGLRAELHQDVEVGAVRGTVVRLTDEGCAVMFKRLLPIEEFGPNLRL